MKNPPEDQVQQHEQPSEASQASQALQTSQTARHTHLAPTVEQVQQPSVQTQPTQAQQTWHSQQHTRGKDGAKLNDIKITEAGVRAVKMNDIAAGGEARAEMLNILAGMMDESIQLLHVVPSEHEAIALMSFVDEGLLEVVKDDMRLSNKTMIATWKVLRTLLDTNALPEKLVLILDPSLMPTTVDMQIALGMVWLWNKDLVKRFGDSDETEHIKVTVFYLTSPFQPWRMIPWKSANRWWQTYQIDKFGCRPHVFDIVEGTIDELESIRTTVLKFLDDVFSSWNDRNTDPEHADGLDPGPQKTLLCITPEIFFNAAMDSFSPDCRAIIDKAIKTYVVGFTEKPREWEDTAETLRKRVAGAVQPRLLLLDPRIGIMHKLPTITHAFICNISELPQYVCNFRRPIHVAPNNTTWRQRQQYIDFLNGSHTNLLNKVYMAVGSQGLPNAVPLRAGWSPSVTSELTQLLLEAHLTWPKLRLVDMPIEPLPDSSATQESLRRLKWFGYINRHGVLHPETPSKLKEVLRHVPDFNLAMLITGINLVDTPPKIAKVVIQIALLLHHKPENFLRCVAEEEDGRMDKSNEASEKSAVDLDNLDAVNEIQLGSSECARKGLLWRAWACLNRTFQRKASKKAALLSDSGNWVVQVLDFEVNYHLFYKIREEAQAIGNLLGIEQCHEWVGKLTNDDVFDVEVHLARAYIFDLAMFVPPTMLSNHIVTTTAIDFHSSLKLNFESRKRDVFFTPPDEDSIRNHRCYAIVFELRMFPGNDVPSILSELFISSGAVSKAALSFTKKRSVPGELAGYWELRALAHERLYF